MGLFIDSIHAKLSDLYNEGRFAGLEKSLAFPYLLLSAATLLALGLRFFRLGRWSFWYDETLEIGYAQNFMRHMVFPVRLSLALEGIALNLLGVNEWTARLYPAIVGVLTIPILFFPIKRLFGTPVALLSSFLLAVSPWGLFWSQNARFYTTLLLFYALAQFYFFFWSENHRLPYLIISMVLLFLAVEERLMALFFVPVVLVYFFALQFLVPEKDSFFRWKYLLYLLIPCVLIVGYFIFGTQNVQLFFQKIVGHHQNPVRVLLSVIYDLGLPLFLMALSAGVYLVVQKNKAGIFILCGAVVPLVLLVAVSPFAQAFDRYVFLTLPNWVILGSIAVKELFAHTQKQLKILALGVLLILAVDAFSQNVLYYGFQNGNREDYKGAFEYIKQNKSPGDWVITGWPELGNYYMGEEVTWDRDVTPDEITRSGKKAWLLIDNRSGFSSDLAGWAEKNGKLLGVYDVYIPGKVMMARVYLYDPQSG